MQFRRIIPLLAALCMLFKLSVAQEYKPVVRVIGLWVPVPEMVGFTGQDSISARFFVDDVKVGVEDLFSKRNLLVVDIASRNDAQNIPMIDVIVKLVISLEDRDDNPDTMLNNIRLEAQLVPPVESDVVIARRMTSINSKAAFKYGTNEFSILAKNIVNKAARLDLFEELLTDRGLAVYLSKQLFLQTPPQTSEKPATAGEMVTNQVLDQVASAIHVHYGDNVNINQLNIQKLAEEANGKSIRTDSKLVRIEDVDAYANLIATYVARDMTIGLNDIKTLVQHVIVPRYLVYNGDVPEFSTNEASLFIVGNGVHYSPIQLSNILTDSAARQKNESLTEFQFISLNPLHPQFEYSAEDGLMITINVDDLTPEKDRLLYQVSRFEEMDLLLLK